MLTKTGARELAEINEKARALNRTGKREIKITFDPARYSFTVTAADKKGIRVTQTDWNGKTTREKTETHKEDREKTARIGSAIAKMRAEGTESKASHPVLYGRLLELAGIIKGEKIIELGASTGNLTRQIAALAGEVHAVDLSPESAKELEKIGGNVKPHQKEYLGFLTCFKGKTDRIISALGTDFHTLPITLFRKAAAKLRVGGTITLLERTPLHEHLREQLEAAGLNIKHVEVHKMPYGEHEAYYTIIHAEKPAPKPAAR